MSRRSKRKNSKKREEIEEEVIEEEAIDEVSEEEEEVDDSVEEEIEEEDEKKEDDDEEEEEEEKESDVKEITIDMSTWGIPIAIIIAGIIIALAVYFSNKSRTDTSSTYNNSGTQTVDNNNNDSGNKDNGSLSINIDGDPYLGTLENGKVAMVEFTDPFCGYCKRFHTQTFDSIKKDYIDTGKIIYVYKEFPLTNDKESLRYHLVEGGECVYRLTNNTEAFVKFHGGAFDVESEDGMRTLAESTGVDMTAFNECISNHTYASEVSKDSEEGQNLGISGTPSFLIGKVDANGKITGTVTVGALSYSSFQSKLDALL